MKPVEELRKIITAPRTELRPLSIYENEAILLAMLDHIDRLNGRSDIMAEVAEGHTVIMRAKDVVPIDIHQKLRHDFVKAYRELVMLNAAVGDCENGRITVNSIRLRQSDLLARDDEYQRTIREEGDLRRAKSAYKEWNRSRTIADISAGDPIVDLNSYNVPDQYDRMDFRELAEAIAARGGLYAPTADTPSQTEDMRRWLRDDDATKINSTNFLKNVLLAKLHTFVLDRESGLKHTTYRVCKCGLSEFNLIHTREDTNAKTNQDSSQAQDC